MRGRTGIIAACLLGVAVLLAGGVAHAQDPAWIPLRTHAYDPPSCEPCHWVLEPQNWPLGDETLQKYGPHGYYFSTTNRCVYCHTMHEAEELVIFQETTPSAVRDTISELCFACHDSTGGRGVYSQVESLGYTVNGEHSVDVTVTVPGSNLGDLHLTCVSCHTPHNNTLMAGNYMSFNPRGFGQGFTAYETNRLLRDDVGRTPKGTYTQYGSRWCAACHDRRHNENPSIKNHPVDLASAYQAYVNDAASAPNLGVFIFYPVAGNPYEPPGETRVSPRPASPRCQQCHESSMDVEGDYTWDLSNASRIIDPDGSGPSDPTTVADSYPHQTTGANLLVETGDDLCLNCHATDNLP